MNEKFVVLVTGANRGIGLEVCRQLAAAGCLVVLTGRDGSKAEAAARHHHCWVRKLRKQFLSWIWRT